VRRVVFDGTTATGVEVSGPGGRVEVIDGGEVVLCAGALKTPQLLLLSGIGPSAQLAEHGVALVSDRAGVGENLMDHPDIELTWRPKKAMASKRQRDSFQGCLNFTSQDATCEGDIEILPTIKPIAAMLLAREESGLQAALTFVKRAPAALKQLKGTSVKRLLAQAARRNDLFVVVALQQEDARGRVSLQSADPAQAPRIEFDYMSSERDRRRMREAVRTCAGLLTSRAMSEIFDRMTEMTPAILGSDDKLDAWVSKHLAPTFHATSTCRMGPADDPGAVVDQRGRVHGVSGLRVGDVSICPTIPTRGPNNTAIMIGERMADLIKEDRAA
jgi:choline dehydrogenase